MNWISAKLKQPGSQRTVLAYIDGEFEFAKFSENKWFVCQCGKWKEINEFSEVTDWQDIEEPI